MEIIKEVMVPVTKEVETDDCDCLTGVKFLDVWNKLFKIRGDVSADCLTERQFIEMVSMSFNANAKVLMEAGNYTDRKLYLDDNRETEHNSIVSKSQERFVSKSMSKTGGFTKHLSSSPFMKAKKQNYVGFNEDIDEEFDREDDSDRRSKNEIEMLRNARATMQDSSLTKSMQINPHKGQKTNLLGRTKHDNIVTSEERYSYPYSESKTTDFS